MKKYLSVLLFSIILCGCSDNTQTAGRATVSQNNVESVLQAGIAEQASAEDTTAAVVEETTEAENLAAENVDTVIETPVEPTSSVSDETNDISEADMVDLSSMNATMVYSEVFAMMTEPGEYFGKTIKMTGVCNRYTDIETGADYYACIITDATACCAQGIEFKLPEGEEYPQMGTTITVLGTFGSYMENGNEYFVLLDSKLLS